MIGKPTASAASRARYSGCNPAALPTIASLVKRTLTPRITSRLASIMAIARGTLAKRMSSSSPISGFNMPCAEMLSWAKRRVALTSITYLRKPGKVSAPDEPASTAVVTPLAIQCGSGSMLKWLAPQKTWTCKSIIPGATRRSRQSITWRAAATGRAGATATTLPPAKATSCTAWIAWAGSTNIPPLSTKSYCMRRSPLTDWLACTLHIKHGASRNFGKGCLFVVI